MSTDEHRCPRGRRCVPTAPPTARSPTRASRAACKRSPRRHPCLHAGAYLRRRLLLRVRLGPLVCGLLVPIPQRALAGAAVRMLGCSMRCAHAGRRMCSAAMSACNPIITATPSSQQPHHHSNPIITATPSSQQPHHHSNPIITATPLSQQPHHHSNPIITATPSSQQPHHHSNPIITATPSSQQVPLGYSCSSPSSSSSACKRSPRRHPCLHAGAHLLHLPHPHPTHATHGRRALRPCALDCRRLCAHPY